MHTHTYTTHTRRGRISRKKADSLVRPSGMLEVARIALLKTNSSMTFPLKAARKKIAFFIELLGGWLTEWQKCSGRSDPKSRECQRQMLEVSRNKLEHPCSRDRRGCVLISAAALIPLARSTSSFQDLQTANSSSVPVASVRSASNPAKKAGCNLNTAKPSSIHWAMTRTSMVSPITISRGRVQTRQGCLWS